MAMPFLFTSVEYIEFVKELYILYIYKKKRQFQILFGNGH